MKLKYILPSALVALFGIFYISEPVQAVEPEVRQAIKLTTRHLPISCYFTDVNEDEDASLTVAQQYMIVRRDTTVQAKIDIVVTEDDVVITDAIRLRLMLARFKALDRYNAIHGVDKV